MIETLIHQLAKRCASIILYLACAAATLSPAAHAEMMDGIVAVVGDSIVLRSELALRMSEVEQQLRAQGTPLPSRENLQQQVLERIILRKLQLQRAEQRGIVPSEIEVTDALTKIARRNGMTPEQMQNAMAADGVDPARYRQEIRDELAITQLRQQEIEGRIGVSEGDVDMYLESQRATMQEEYHLRHILIGLPGDATDAQREAAREKAQQVLDRIQAGQDFAQAAASYSEGRQALNGGDLGWRTAATLPTMFANKVPSMQEGEVSDLIATRSGYHIIRLEGSRRGPTAIKRSEVKARHILLAPNDMRDKEASRKEAERLYEQLLNGEDFAELAKRWSDDPGSAAQGGELGWQSTSAFVEEFQEKAEQLRVGEISKPFSSPFGWHVLQVQDRREKKGAPQAVREAARQEIFQRKANEEYELWLRRIRDEAYVEYRL